MARLPTLPPIPRLPISDRTRMWLRRGVLYPSYFVACFVACAYCSFPYDRVRDQIEYAVESQIPGSDLEIVSVSPSWITGVVAEGVSLQLPGEAGERPTSISLTELRLRVGVLAYLGGTTHVSYYGELGGGGTIEGTFEEMHSEDRVSQQQIDLHLENVALGRIGPLRPYTMLPITGTLSGDVHLTLANEIANTEGEIVLAIEDLTIGDGRARLQIPGLGSGVTVQQVNAGDLQARLQIERGVGRIQQLAASSDDIDFRAAGTIGFRLPIQISTVSTLLRFEIRAPYLERDARVGALLEHPMVRPYRSADGALQVALSGSFGTRIQSRAAGSETLPQ